MNSTYSDTESSLGVKENDSELQEFELTPDVHDIVHINITLRSIIPTTIDDFRLRKVSGIKSKTVLR